jgi:hypothetical protein
LGGREFILPEKRIRLPDKAIAAKMNSYEQQTPVGSLAALYVPLEYAGLAPMGIGLVARVIRRKKFPKRLRAGETGNVELEEVSPP